MLFCLLLIIVFIQAEHNSLMLFMIIMFVLISQSTTGPIKFIHIFETCVDSAAGLNEFLLFIINSAVAIICEKLIKEIGTQGMFAFFASFTCVGTMYYILFLKDTTYKFIEEITEDGKKEVLKVRLTDKEKQELYMPEEFKDKRTLNTISSEPILNPQEI